MHAPAGQGRPSQVALIFLEGASTIGRPVRSAAPSAAGTDPWSADGRGWPSSPDGPGVIGRRSSGRVGRTGLTQPRVGRIESVLGRIAGPEFGPGDGLTFRVPTSATSRNEPRTRLRSPVATSRVPVCGPLVGHRATAPRPDRGERPVRQAGVSLAGQAPPPDSGGSHQGFLRVKDAYHRAPAAWPSRVR
jgi:hypothetical protein